MPTRYRHFTIPTADFTRRRSSTLKTAEEYKPYGNRFIHLRADISEFSSNSRWGDSTNYSHGTTQDLTEDFLDSFRKYLDRVRTQNSTVIVRFSYDPWYSGSWKYQKGFEMEPGQEWILRHVGRKLRRKHLP